MLIALYIFLGIVVFDCLLVAVLCTRKSRSVEPLEDSEIILTPDFVQ